MLEQHAEEKPREVFLSEAQVDEKIKELKESVEKLKKKYGLRLPDPNFPLLFIINRTIDTTSFLGDKQDRNPYQPTILANWLGAAERIFRFGTTCMDAKLYREYFHDIPSSGETVDSTSAIANLIEYSAIDDISENTLKDMLRDLLLDGKEGSDLNEEQIQTRVWEKTNLAVRTALIWSGLLAQDVLGSSPTLPPLINKGPYALENDARRLALSERAHKLHEDGKLDLFLPPNFSDPKKPRTTAEYMDIVNANPVDAEWSRKYEEEYMQVEPQLQDAIAKLRETLGYLPLPKGLLFLPVRYGTVGSFSNQHASLINNLTFEPSRYDDNNNTMTSSREGAEKVVGQPFNTREIFGAITDTYSAVESFYRYPYIIYVRIPAKTEELGPFMRDKFVPMCVEEYLHTSVYVFSTFHKLPHALEEHLVKRLLTASSLDHSGTPADLGKVRGEAFAKNYDTLIDKLLRKEITFGDFVDQVSRAYHSP